MSSAKAKSSAAWKQRKRCGANSGNGTRFWHSGHVSGSESLTVVLANWSINSRKDAVELSGWMIVHCHQTKINQRYCQSIPHPDTLFLRTESVVLLIGGALADRFIFRLRLPLPSCESPKNKQLKNNVTSMQFQNTRRSIIRRRLKKMEWNDWSDGGWACWTRCTLKLGFSWLNSFFVGRMNNNEKI